MPEPPQLLTLDPKDQTLSNIIEKVNRVPQIRVQFYLCVCVTSELTRHTVHTEGVGLGNFCDRLNEDFFPISFDSCGAPMSFQYYM